MRVAVPKYEPHAQAAAPSPRAVADAVKGRRDIWIDGRTVAATIYERDRLDIGAAVAGPAVVEQFDATTVVPPGWRGRVDGFRNLVLERT